MSQGRNPTRTRSPPRTSTPAGTGTSNAPSAEPDPAVVDLTVEQVDLRLTERAGDERVGGAAPDLLRGADLHQRALPQHRDAVAESQRLLVVVGDVDRGGLRHRAELLELGPHRRPQLRVEVAQRFVEQVDVGGPHQHPAERHPLPLAVGQLARKALEQVVDSERRGDLVDPLAAAARRCTCPSARTSAATPGSR